MRERASWGRLSRRELQPSIFHSRADEPYPNQDSICGGPGNSKSQREQLRASQSPLLSWLFSGNLTFEGQCSQLDQSRESLFQRHRLAHSSHTSVSPTLFQKAACCEMCYADSFPADFCRFQCSNSGNRLSHAWYNLIIATNFLLTCQV